MPEITHQDFVIFENWAPQEFRTWAQSKAHRSGVSSDEWMMALLQKIRTFQWKTIAHLMKAENRAYRGMPVTIVAEEGQVMSSAFILGTALDRKSHVSEVLTLEDAIQLVSVEEFLAIPLRFNMEELIRAEVKTPDHSKVGGARMGKANALNAKVVMDAINHGGEFLKIFLRVIVEETFHFMETQDEADSLQEVALHSLDQKWAREKEIGIHKTVMEMVHAMSQEETHVLSLPISS